MQSITAQQLLALLDHADQEVQQFGAGLLGTLSGVDTWPIATWLELLETRSVTALATICEAMKQRVSPERLSLEQCVALACARATPVARLGLSWLSGRPVTRLHDRATIGRLAGAQCEAVGAAVAEYALSILGSPQAYHMEDVSPFFDSLNAQVRRGAWEWLTPSSPGYDDAALWSRLLETPYDDVRLRLVEELNKRTRETDGPTALKRQDLSMVWMTVLLGVHRGGRAKLKALRQISRGDCGAAGSGRAFGAGAGRGDPLGEAARGPCGTRRDSLSRFGQARSGGNARAVHPRTAADFRWGGTVRVSFAYLGRSRMLESSAGNGRTLSMLPNLAREKVSFDAPLLHPLRFREAISALHDVVINDLRFKPRDKTAYEEWKKQQAAAKQALYRSELERAKKDLATQRGLTPPPPGFEALFERTRKRYWGARFKLADLLRRDDPELWRWLMPCDPVITVADDVVFFECFSADESSYGCLSVSREGFGPGSAVQLGTTNVDYSWDLYQPLSVVAIVPANTVSDRSRRVRGQDRCGAGISRGKDRSARGWLRGFMTTQEAMGMPGLSVSLSREAVYSALAFLKRHKAKKSPRAVRFELLPGKAPAIVLEPWEQRIVSYGTTYDGPTTEPIRIWGARRLLVLARLLPLAERFGVLLLGTGLPSFWVAHMGEMQLTLGLSGWTTNDWTRGSALDLLAPPATITEDLLLQGWPAVAGTKGPVARAVASRDAGAGAGRDGGAAAAGIRRSGDPRSAARRLSFPPGDADGARRGAARPGKPGAHRGTTPDADPRFDARNGGAHRTRNGADRQGRVDASGNPRRSGWPHPPRQVSVRAFSPVRHSQRALPAHDCAAVSVDDDSFRWIIDEQWLCVTELAPGVSNPHETRVGRVRVRLTETISTALRRG